METDENMNPAEAGPSDPVRAGNLAQRRQMNLNPEDEQALEVAIAAEKGDGTPGTRSEVEARLLLEQTKIQRIREEKELMKMQNEVRTTNGDGGTWQAKGKGKGFPKPQTFRPPKDDPVRNKRYCQKYCHDLMKYYECEFHGNKDVSPIDAFSITSDDTFDFVQAMTRKNAAKTLVDEPPFTIQEVCDMIISRYAPGVFLEQNERKKLLTGGVRMNPKKNVASYYIDFTNAVEKAQVMLDDPTLAVLFLQGLTDPLQLRCQVGQDKKPFTSLQSIYDHALGAEIEVKHLKDTHGVRVHVMRQDKRKNRDRSGPSAKRAKGEHERVRAPKMTLNDHIAAVKKQFNCQHEDDVTKYVLGLTNKALTVRELAELRFEGKCTYCAGPSHIWATCQKRKDAMGIK